MNDVVKSAMHVELERMFGTDEAIGVRILVAGRDEPMSMMEFEAHKAKNPGFAENGDYKVEMPDGSSTVVCTNYAIHIERTLPGRVQRAGFFCGAIPDCEFSKRDYAEGHDFAIVDDRYLVDPWLKLVYDEADEPVVYDLQDPAQAAQAAAMYGDRSLWELATEAA
jgi:hypothetical protein